MNLQYFYLSCWLFVCKQKSNKWNAFFPFIFCEFYLLIIDFCKHLKTHKYGILLNQVTSCSKYCSTESIVYNSPYQWGFYISLKS